MEKFSCRQNSADAETNPKRKKSLEDIAKEVTSRGNDLIIKSSKNGIKVFEVSMSLITEIEL